MEIEDYRRLFRVKNHRVDLVRKSCQMEVKLRKTFFTYILQFHSDYNQRIEDIRNPLSYSRIDMD